MDTHEYVLVFQNLNILCIFSDRFFSSFFSGSVPVFWVDRFNDRSGSGNFGEEYSFYIWTYHHLTTIALSMHKFLWLNFYE
jgi:hypothetical protein